MRTLLIIAAIACTTLLSQAQSIFTYGGTPVDKNEFVRMYTKNAMQKTPDMSEKALREYITLYSRFKMKVAEAELQYIDTLPNIKSELATYKKQIAKSFLTDKDVVSNLSKETYERLKLEVNAAHIMVQIPRGQERDSLAYKAKIDSIYKVLASNKATWEQLASTFSDDKATATNGGNIGYFTALQTPYLFESQVYNTTKGNYSKPFRTSMGYHIVKRLGDRPTRGEVQVAQILVMVRKLEGEQGKAAAKAKADSLYAALKKGAIWDSLVVKYSEDKFSKNSNGELAAFTVGAMAPEFEAAAFELKNPGELSKPVLTNYGYHIIKLIKKIPLKPYDDYKGELAKKVERDGRVESARTTFIAKLKEKYKYSENNINYNNLMESIPDTALRNGGIDFNAIPKTSNTLLTVAGISYSVDDFVTYVIGVSRGRVFGAKDVALKTTFNNYAEKIVLDTEEKNLEQENPEYKNLLKEYRDGIILFDLTDKMVWAKAGSDSIGLDKYYNTHLDKYKWAPGFEGSLIRCSDLKGTQVFLEAVKTGKTIEEAVEAVNNTSGTSASQENGRYEYDKYPTEFKKLTNGQYSSASKNTDNTYTIAYINKVNTAATTKTLLEARGYVIADYQDALEKEWLASLEAKYPVKVNDAVLKSLVK
jgi:peptidyl-prolyl cis-trans isomerase SurA